MSEDIHENIPGSGRYLLNPPLRSPGEQRAPASRSGVKQLTSGVARRVLAAALAALALLTPLASKTQDQELVWARSMGGSVADDRSYSVAVDAAGNVYTTGYLQGTADFDPGPGMQNLTSAGSDDIFVSKLDADGNFLWARSMGGEDADCGYSVAVDPAGNVYTTGVFQGTADFDPDPDVTYELASALRTNEVFVSKLDSGGTFLWARRLGGLVDDVGTSLALDRSGNVYITGVFRGTADFDPDPQATYNLTSAAGYDDIFVSKLDGDGNFVWAKRMGGSYPDIALSVTVDGSDNVYTTGYFSGSADFDPGEGTHQLATAANVAEVFISKLDSNGDFVWAKSQGGSQDDIGFSIAVDRRGSVYITGNFQGTADFDPGPGTYSISARHRDIFVSKLDTNGSFVWAKRLGGIQDDSGSAVAVDQRGNVYSTGSFVAQADFDPGPGVHNLTARYRDVFVSKLDANGEFVWAKSMGGTSDEAAYSVVVDQTGNVYTTGFFTNTADFDPGPGANNLDSAGSADSFVLKLGSNSR